MLACLWKRTALSTGTPIGNLEGGSFTGKFDRQMKKGSGHGPSLSLSLWERGDTGGRDPLLGTLKATRDISRKALGIQHLSVYTGFMRGTWRKGSNS